MRRVTVVDNAGSVRQGALRAGAKDVYHRPRRRMPKRRSVPAQNNGTPLPPLVLEVTLDEERAREQVIDCAVAWADNPDRYNSRDLRAAVEILRLADGSADALPPTIPGSANFSAVRRALLEDYYRDR